MRVVKLGARRAPQMRGNAMFLAKAHDCAHPDRA